MSLVNANAFIRIVNGTAKINAIYLSGIELHNWLSPTPDCSVLLFTQKCVIHSNTTKEMRYNNMTKSQGHMCVATAQRRRGSSAVLQSRKEVMGAAG